MLRRFSMIGRYALRNASPTLFTIANDCSKPGSEKSSKKIPPMPRVALHVRKADACTVEELAAFQNARAAAAAQLFAGRALPCIGGERRAIEGAKRVGDMRLQALQPGANGLRGVGVVNRIGHGCG